jgi:hypothetical protein
LGRFLDRINKINTIGSQSDFLTGKHEVMKRGGKASRVIYWIGLK